MNNIDRFFTADIESYSRSYLDYLKQVLDQIDVGKIKEFVETLINAREQGAMIFFIGNGGSAATASHFANDLAFGTSEYENPFRVMSLTDNVPVITALGNDNGYDEIFIRQLKVYAKPGDVVVGISASGNSPNMVNAFNYCNSNNIHTVAITAFDGGTMKQLAETCVHVPTDYKEYGPAEDAHMVLDLLVGSYLMRAINSD